jgi:hypothetical protein
MQLNLLFLLGGSDLEMRTIEAILTQKNIPYIDRNLTWNTAKISAYEDVIRNKKNANVNIYGIELVEDNQEPLPPNYHSMDHHNERAHELASIEQVAKLLGLELTREQQLVAANDKGYIPAMEAMGATPEEIAGIRRRDREAQGVTEEDERLAEQSISENLTKQQGITVVKSFTSRFSAITDRLYPCERLLIYTDVELTYFGKGVSRLIQAFDDLVKQQLAYSGGGESGFFGITEEGIKKIGTIENVSDQIVNTLLYGK